MADVKPTRRPRPCEPSGMTPSTRTSPILTQLAARLQAFSRQNARPPKCTREHLTSRGCLGLPFRHNRRRTAPVGDPVIEQSNIVEIRIDHGNRQQREQERQRLPADGEHGDRAALFRAGTGRDQAAAIGRRRTKSSSSKSGRSRSRLACRIASSRFIPLARKHVGMIDLQNRRLLDHAEQHQDAQGRIEIERLASPVQADKPNGTASGSDSKIVKRMHEVLVLGREHDVHEDERQGERPDKIRQRPLQLAAAAQHPRFKAGRNADLLGRGLQSPRCGWRGRIRAPRLARIATIRCRSSRSMRAGGRAPLERDDVVDPRQNGGDDPPSPSSALRVAARGLART